MTISIKRYDSNGNGPYLHEFENENDYQEWVKDFNPDDYEHAGDKTNTVEAPPTLPNFPNSQTVDITPPLYTREAPDPATLNSTAPAPADGDNQNGG